VPVGVLASVTILVYISLLRLFHRPSICVSGANIEKHTHSGKADRTDGHPGGRKENGMNVGSLGEISRKCKVSKCSGILNIYLPFERKLHDIYSRPSNLSPLMGGLGSDLRDTFFFF
jgi:hypothetical protein